MTRSSPACRFARDVVRDALLGIALFGLCVVPVAAFCGCSAQSTDATRPVWNGEQRALTEELLEPQHLEALTRIVCAESWAERFPEDRAVAYHALAEATVHYVDEAALVEWQNSYAEQTGIVYRNVWETTPSCYETFVAHDLGDPLLNLAHGCGHLVEFCRDGYSDHSDPAVWSEDGGVIPLTQQRLDDLLPLADFR